MDRYRKEAKAAIEQLNIDLRKHKWTLEDLARGIKVEYEHGSENPLTNATNDDPLMTAKIALAHLMEERNGEEQYDYYDGLDIVEEAPAGYWRGKTFENLISGSGVNHIRIVIAILIVTLLIIIFYLSGGELADTAVIIGIIASVATLIAVVN